MTIGAFALFAGIFLTARKSGVVGLKKDDFPIGERVFMKNATVVLLALLSPVLFARPVEGWFAEGHEIVPVIAPTISRRLLDRTSRKF